VVVQSNDDRCWFRRQHGGIDVSGRLARKGVLTGVSVMDHGLFAYGRKASSAIAVESDASEL